jgi:hypothetical protein
MRKIGLIRLAGATAVVVLGLGACGEGAEEDVVPEENPPPGATTTVAQPEHFPNDCGVRLPRLDTSVRC